MFRKGKFMATQDRRIRKTKAVLKSSLVSLMKEKNVKNITVKELCERADINRGTFYLHYKDIFDMLEQIETEFFSEFTTIIDNYGKSPQQSRLYILENIFALTKSHKDFCLVLLSSKGDMGFIKKLLSHIHNIFVEVYGDEGMTAEYYFSFIIYGCIGVVENWLKGDAKESVEDIAKITENIILNGNREYIK